MKTFIMAAMIILTSSLSMADCSSGNCAVRKSVNVTREVVKVPVNVCRQVVTAHSRVRHRRCCSCR